MAILDRVIENEREILRICGEIKTEANIKGANIQDLQAFSEWPAQIRSIPSQFAPIWYSVSNKIAGVQLLDTLTIPTECITPTGEKLPLANTTLQFNTNEININVLCAAKKLIIPDFFQNANLWAGLPNSDSWGQYTCHLEEVDFYGRGNCSFATVNSTTGGGYHMRRVYAPIMEGACEFNFQKLPTNGNFEIIMPKSTRISSMKLHAVDNSPVTLTGNFSGIEIIENSSNQNNSVGFNNISCNLDLPTCTKLGNIALSKYDVTLRLPALTWLNKTFSTVETGTGVTHLYIGRNLATVQTEAQANILANSARIKIHIPSGDSTTKTTLDTAGITYTQDYDIDIGG